MQTVMTKVSLMSTSEIVMMMKAMIVMIRDIMKMMNTEQKIIMKTVVLINLRT